MITKMQTLTVFILLRTYPATSNWDETMERYNQIVSRKLTREKKNEAVSNGDYQLFKISKAVDNT